MINELRRKMQQKEFLSYLIMILNKTKRKTDDKHEFYRE